MSDIDNIDKLLEAADPGEPQIPGQRSEPVYYSPVTVAIKETEYTKKLKDDFPYFGLMGLVFAFFYCFCTFQNTSGICFIFFVITALLYFEKGLKKLGVSVKKGTYMYVVPVILLSISTFCTDNEAIIAYNKCGILLLFISMLLHCFYDTAKWKLHKWIKSILQTVFYSIGEFEAPFKSGSAFFKNSEDARIKKVGLSLVGIGVTVPVLILVLVLLSSADAIFREMVNSLLKLIDPFNLFEIVFRIVVMYFGTYLIISWLCKKQMDEKVREYDSREPIPAIILTSALTIVYLIFSVIQVMSLFLHKMKLPENYTYAEYAREGFFELLFVSFLNLVIILICITMFRAGRALQVIMTVMSLCTFIMIASSAMRMIIYVKYYYLTFLRVLVLWALVMLFILFIGVMISIFKKDMPLFSYCIVVVSAMYILLSFSHPDLIIARVNISNAIRTTDGSEHTESTFFETDQPYRDFSYLNRLSMDAAPVIIPYVRSLGYDTDPGTFGKNVPSPFNRLEDFMKRADDCKKEKDIRRFNISRFIASGL